MPTITSLRVRQTSKDFKGFKLLTFKDADHAGLIEVEHCEQVTSDSTSDSTSCKQYSKAKTIFPELSQLTKMAVTTPLPKPKQQKQLPDIRDIQRPAAFARSTTEPAEMSESDMLCLTKDELYNALILLETLSEGRPKTYNEVIVLATLRNHVYCKNCGQVFFNCHEKCTSQPQIKIGKTVL